MIQACIFVSVMDLNRLMPILYLFKNLLNIYWLSSCQATYSSAVQITLSEDVCILMVKFVSK